MTTLIGEDLELLEDMHLESLREGIKQAGSGNVKSRGSFATHVEKSVFDE